jgi:formate hydrogenlyase transcriptional activator
MSQTTYNQGMASAGNGIQQARRAEDFCLVVDAIPTLAWAARSDGSADFFNKRWLDYTGLSAEQARDWGWTAALHSEDLNRLVDYWRSVLASGEAGEIEARLRRFDGVYRWFLFRATPSLDSDGRIVKWFGTNTDIEDRKRAESLLAGENLVLEMTAKGKPLEAILEALCRVVEQTASGCLCSVMLIDPSGSKIQQAVAPSLPASYRDRFRGTPVEREGGPCTEAARQKRQVVVPDVASETRWDAYGWRAAALADGLKACWSTTILDSSGLVLGTFAMYWREPRSPSECDQKIIEQVTHLAAVAIERKRNEAALMKAFEELGKSEAELRTVIDAIPQLITAIGTDGKFLYANQAVLEYTGLTKEEVESERFREVFHKEDSERLREERDAAISRGAPFGFERRMRRKDGQFRWLLVQYNPLLNERGEAIRWYATGTDIDDRKQAEERTRQENFALREQIDQVFMFEEIVGSSLALKTVLSSLVNVAPTDSTVLITGETGTGKELIARAIHKGSTRAGQPFISVNCAAIPTSLIASELFGHEKGAFTGAMQRRQGRFELAHTGTIFLDEIGELPAETQIALLRVLQERQFERVGGNLVLSTDVRVIAATNRDLAAAMAAGSFRADLYYRLNVFPIQVPPLRERKEDILMLVEYFVKRYADKARKRISKIDKNTLTLCQAYPWPGNIRELQNIVERSVILCEGDIFRIDEAWLSRPNVASPKSAGPLTESLKSYEKELIEAALAESDGKVAGPNGAAAKLGVPRSTLDFKVKQLNIKKNSVK